MTDDRQRFWNLVEKLDICMFTTMTDDGMRARPMSSVVRPDEQIIYFLTEETGPLPSAVRHEPSVLLNYANGSSQFVAVSGIATVRHDHDLIRRLWNPGAQAFWPDGPETPGVVAIAVAPDEASYWEGPSGPVAMGKMIFALATGSTPGLGEKRRVAF